MVLGLLGWLNGPIPYPDFVSPALRILHKGLGAELLASGLIALVVAAAARWLKTKQQRNLDGLADGMDAEDNSEPPVIEAEYRMVDGEDNG